MGIVPSTSTILGSSRWSTAEANSARGSTPNSSFPPGSFLRPRLLELLPPPPPILPRLLTEDRLPFRPAAVLVFALEEPPSAELEDTPSSSPSWLDTLLPAPLVDGDASGDAQKKDHHENDNDNRRSGGSAAAAFSSGLQFCDLLFGSGVLMEARVNQAWKLGNLGQFDRLLAATLLED
ncbi:hypothetical protein TYRP_021253 [Tyrophagus putrescentiae]|nr:hypothetical protein TYRP_021253 [Tyrophagus putrescentiae]